MWDVRSWLTSFCVAFAAFAACSHHADPGQTDAAATCPNDLPTACPSTVPSYKDDVAFIFEVHCNSCHGPAGTAEDRPLTDYASVYRQRSSVLNQIYNCHMPPESERPLTAEQRAKALAWLVCRAPNN